MNRRVIGLSFLSLGLLAMSPSVASAQSELAIDARAWTVMKRDSGPTNYYTVVDNNGGPPYVHAQYEPPMKTTVLGYQIPDADRSRAKKLRWQWRAVTLPDGGDECTKGKTDSVAVVYVVWKRGLKYYTLKYVWSAVGKKGSVCDSKRNLFMAQDTVLLESGGPLNQWRFVEIDLAHQFRHYFEGDDPKASVPDLVGLGIMSDGDDTHSTSAADYGQFTLIR
jgi:hypothetical protein